MSSVVYDVVWLQFMWLCVLVFVLACDSCCAMVYPRLDKSFFFFKKIDIRRRSNGHVTVQFLVESTDCLSHMTGVLLSRSVVQWKGCLPPTWSLIPLLARSPVVHGRLEMRRRQAKTLQGQLVELRERRASSEAVDVRAQHKPLRADVECESGP